MNATVVATLFARRPGPGAAHGAALLLLLTAALAACGGGSHPAGTTTGTTTDASVDARSEVEPESGDVVADADILETAQAAASNVRDFRPAGYSLVMSEEFDGTTLDRSRWCTRYVYGGGPAPQMADADCQRFGRGTLDFLNDEQQRYVDFNAFGQPMHAVSGGVLTLRATRTGLSPLAPYESALLRSKATWRPDARRSYYITARVKLPSGKGTWPAFWLNPELMPDGRGVWPPEIDIFEGPLNGVQNAANMLNVNVHRADGVKPTWTRRSSRFDSSTRNYVWPRSLRGVWIESGVEWTNDRVTFYIDGRRVASTLFKWVRKDGSAAPPATILLNLAVGGHWAGRYGVTGDAFPTAMQVDHVRVYRKQS